jgi:hypothetical protein
MRQCVPAYALRRSWCHWAPALNRAVLPAFAVPPYLARLPRPLPPRGGPTPRPTMSNAFLRSPHNRWAIPWATLLALAVACGSDESPGITGSGVPTESPVGADSLRIADSLRVADSLARADTVTAPDTLPDPDTNPDSLSPPLPPVTHSGIPFGPFDLFASWESPAVSGFGGTVMYVRPGAVIMLINSMRAHNIRGFLKLTGEPHDAYKTDGKFDFAKWKAGTDQYDTPAIKAAIAAAVADGTVLGYSMIDEPNRFSWNGSVDKAMLDKMATYSKSIFPTLPTAAVLPYSWRPDERYQVMDVMIAGTWKPTLTPQAFRDSAIATAKANGIGLAFALNIMAAPQVPGCEPRSPGSRTCLMTPAQIKEWGVTLGEASCGMFMWTYEDALFARSAYVEAFQHVADKLASHQVPTCRRS